MHPIFRQEKKKKNYNKTFKFFFIIRIEQNMRKVYKLTMRASASSLWYKMCTQDFLTNMAEHIDE
jgi:hypothetical protein